MANIYQDQLNEKRPGLSPGAPRPLGPAQGPQMRPPPATAPASRDLNVNKGLAGMAPGTATPGAQQMGAAHNQNVANYNTTAQYNDFLHGTGPTQTGFLNFDSFAGANGQAARDSAKRLNAANDAAATKAKQGVQDVNDSYQKQLQAGVSASGGAQMTQGDMDSATKLGANGPHLTGKEPTAATPSDPKVNTGAQYNTNNEGGPESTSQAVTGDSTKPGATPPASPPAGAPPGSGGAAGPVYPPATKPPATAPPAAPVAPSAAPPAPPAWGNPPPTPLPANTAPSGAPGNVSPPGVTDNANANAPSSGDPYRDMLLRGSQMSYTGPTNLSGDPRYAQVGTDVRNAQRGLDATQTAGGVGTAAGGTAADGALMNQQGQRAFANTRDKFGNLNDYARNVDANAAAEGDQTKREAQGRVLSYQDQLGQYDAKKAADAKTAAANQPFTDDARKALPGYQQYTEGSKDKVTGLGTKSDFVNSLGSGKNAPGEGTAFNGRAQQFADAATKSLGISIEQLKSTMSKMTDQEYQDFWIAGVIPPWMDAPGAARGTGGASKGTAGGWPSPFADSAANYNPEGMGNAVQNTQASQLKTVGTIASFI